MKGKRKNPDETGRNKEALNLPPRGRVSKTRFANAPISDIGVGKTSARRRCDECEGQQGSETTVP